MTRTVRVTKMHGTLNDFVVIDNRHEHVGDLVTLGRFVCDRHAGLGADGLLAIESSAVADARMLVVNADGSEAEMCGNGIRCVARYLAEAGNGDRLRIETLAGIVTTEVLSREPEFLVRQVMGTPLVRSFDASQLSGVPASSKAYVVSLGNPHVLLFVASLDAIDLPAVAAQLRRTPEFPEGTNVHAVVRESAGALRVRHWERGVGMTMACGTGAVAAAAAAIHARYAVSPVEVYVPGGVLRVEWDGASPASLTGPAVRVLDGELRAGGVHDVVRP